jgi:gamma-glutamyltranspeptidase/glutathione hydrolase/leukotriene-C4 hydrolase
VTKHDFENYKARVQEPAIGYYHGRKVVTTPLPSRYPYAPENENTCHHLTLVLSGPVLLSILNILEGFESYLSEGETSINVHR